MERQDQQAGPASFDDVQRAGLGSREADQDRTLAAMHRLEQALEAAAPGRDIAWREEVVSALAVLNAVTVDETANAEQPDSLLSDIARNQPRLRNRVRGVRLQYRNLRDSLQALSQELEGHGGALDVADIRQRLGWVLTGLRQQRARESDLIYEAYFDAFRRDLIVEHDQAEGPSG